MLNALLSDGTNLIIFIVILGLLVFVHEFGHFIVAKRLHIPVLEFGFGFPPRIVRFWHGSGWIELQGRHIVVPREMTLPQDLTVGTRVVYKTKTERGREVLTALDVVDPESQGLVLSSPVQNVDRGTDYTLNAIPLGGFVRMMGEEDPNVPGGFARAKPSVRAPILLAGVVMNFLLAYVAFMTSAVASPPYVQVQTTKIIGIAQNSPAAIAGLRSGDLIASVNGQDVRDNFPALKQMLDSNAGHEIALSIVRNGKTLDPIAVTPRAHPPQGEGALGIQLNVMRGLRVSSVQPGSPADQAGVHPGDVMVFIIDNQGHTISDQSQLDQYAESHPGLSVQWQIQRNNRMIDPISVKIPENVTSQNANLGVSVQTSILDAPRVAAEQLGTVAATIPLLFNQVARGSVPNNAFVGFVGIYQATGEVAQAGGLVALIEFMGLLSLNLAIVNLLPFPALDGGRLVFVVLEWLRGGKKIDPQKEGLVHLVGIVVLISFMLLITFFDIQRLLSGQSILTP